MTDLIVHDVEGVGGGACLGLHVDAVVLVHGPLAEDDAVEGAVKADLNLHVRFAAHHLQALYVGHVERPFHVPKIDIVLLPICEVEENQGKDHIMPHLELCLV